MELKPLIKIDTFDSVLTKTSTWNLDLYTGDKICIELTERIKSGITLSWFFKINNVEEMSSHFAKCYEFAYEMLLAKISKSLLRIKNLSWLTIGGGDYQLKKFQNKYHKNTNLSVIVDPLSLVLKDIYGLIDEEVRNTPVGVNVPLVFDDFKRHAGIYENFFDVLTIDISDHEDNSGFSSPLDFKNTFDFNEVLPFLKKKSFLIVYEGDNSFNNDNFSSLADNFIIPLCFKEIITIPAGYGKMSLWEIKK